MRSHLKWVAVAIIIVLVTWIGLEIKYHSNSSSIHYDLVACTSMLSQYETVAGQAADWLGSMTDDEIKVNHDEIKKVAKTAASTGQELLNKCGQYFDFETQIKIRNVIATAKK